MFFVSFSDLAGYYAEIRVQTFHLFYNDNIIWNSELIWEKAKTGSTFIAEHCIETDRVSCHIFILFLNTDLYLKDKICIRKVLIFNS